MCFKPVFSSGSRGFQRARPDRRPCPQLLHERPGSVAMRLEEALELLPADGGPDLLVMELATGSERTIDGIADGGRVLLGHPKTREAMRAGLAMYFVTLEDDALMVRRPDRGRARDRALLQHPARRRAGDRDQPRISTVVYQEDPSTFRTSASSMRSARSTPRSSSRCARGCVRAERPCATSTSSRWDAGSVGPPWALRGPPPWGVARAPLPERSQRSPHRWVSPSCRLCADDGRLAPETANEPGGRADLPTERTMTVVDDPRALRPDGSPLRVVHCPVNTAGVPWANVQALRRRGIERRSSSSSAIACTRRRTGRSSDMVGNCDAR